MRTAYAQRLEPSTASGNVVFPFSGVAAHVMSRAQREAFALSAQALPPDRRMTRSALRLEASRWSLRKRKHMAPEHVTGVSRIEEELLLKALGKAAYELWRSFLGLRQQGSGACWMGAHKAAGLTALRLGRPLPGKHASGATWRALRRLEVAGLVWVPKQYARGSKFGAPANDGRFGWQDLGSVPGAPMRRVYVRQVLGDLRWVGDVRAAVVPHETIRWVAARLKRGEQRGGARPGAGRPRKEPGAPTAPYKANRKGSKGYGQAVAPTAKASLREESKGALTPGREQSKGADYLVPPMRRYAFLLREKQGGAGAGGPRNGPDASAQGVGREVRELEPALPEVSSETILAIASRAEPQAPKEWGMGRRKPEPTAEPAPAVQREPSALERACSELGLFSDGARERPRRSHPLPAWMGNPWSLVGGYAQTPRPKRIAPNASDWEAANDLAECYSAAHLAVTGAEFGAFRWRKPKDHKEWANLVLIATSLRTSNVAPAAWIAWTLRAWRHVGRSGFPPLAFVVKPKFLYDSWSVFLQTESGIVAGMLVTVIGPKMQAFVDTRARLVRVLGENPHNESADEIVQRVCTESEYLRLAEEATREAAVQNKLFATRIGRGEFVWSL